MNWISFIHENENEIKKQLVNYYRVKHFFIYYFLKSKTKEAAILRPKILKYKGLSQRIQNIFSDMENQMTDTIDNIKKSLPKIKIFRNDTLIFFLMVYMYSVLKKDAFLQKFIILCISAKVTVYFLFKYFKYGIYEGYLFETLEMITKRSLLSPHNSTIKSKINEMLNEFYFLKDMNTLSDSNVNHYVEVYMEHPVFKLILFLSYTIDKKYSSMIRNKLINKKKKELVNDIRKMISELRHRFNQTIKSVAKIYYTLKRKINVSNNELTDDVEIQPIQAIMMKLNNKINYFYITDEFLKYLYSYIKIDKKDMKRITQRLIHSDNYDIFKDIVEIILVNSDYNILLKTWESYTDKKQLLDEWMTNTLKVIRKNKFHLREQLLSIILSDTVLRNKYYSITDSYKKKFIQCAGMATALIIFFVVK